MTSHELKPFQVFLRFRVSETQLGKNSLYFKIGYHQTLKEYSKVELESLVYETISVHWVKYMSLLTTKC